VADACPNLGGGNGGEKVQKVQELATKLAKPV